MIKLYLSDDIIGLCKSDNADEVKKAVKLVTNCDYQVDLISSINKSNYNITSYKDYLSLNDKYKDRIERKFYIIFNNYSEFESAMLDLSPTKPYIWNWKYSKSNPGYEVTSKGDKRYSPFFMFIEIGNNEISLEDYYQLYIKGYKELGYISGNQVKGLPPLHPELVKGTAHSTFRKYLLNNLGLFYELAVIGKFLPFTDMFDKEGGQNKTYVDILNDFYKL